MFFCLIFSTKFRSFVSSPSIIPIQGVRNYIIYGGYVMLLPKNISGTREYLIYSHEVCHAYTKYAIQMSSCIVHMYKYNQAWLRYTVMWYLIWNKYINMWVITYRRAQLQLWNSCAITVEFILIGRPVW